MIRMRGVQDFEPLAMPGGRRRGAHRGLDNAIQRAGAQVMLCAGAHFLDRLEQARDIDVILGAAHDKRRIVHRHEAGMNFVDEGLELSLASRLFSHEIPFVHGDYTRLVCFAHHAGDLLVHCGDALFRIDHQTAEVRAYNALLRTHHTEDFHRVGDLGSVTNARCVDKHVTLRASLVRDIDSISRSSGDGAYECAFVPQNRVGQG